MSTWLIVSLIVFAVLLILLIGLGIYGTRMQKKSNAQQAQLRESAQNVSMLIIDKKRMKLKDTNLPKMVVEQTPKYLRGTKMPIVKAKVGPKVMSLICDEKIFDLIPVKQEVKALVSGIYIMDVKGLRGNLTAPEKKKSFMQNITSKFKRPKKDA